MIRKITLIQNDSPQKKLPPQLLLIHNDPTDDMENTNDTNQKGDFDSLIKRDEKNVEKSWIDHKKGLKAG